jgi:hypothetical protein
VPAGRGTGELRPQLRRVDERRRAAAQPVRMLAHQNTTIENKLKNTWSNATRFFARGGK